MAEDRRNNCCLYHIATGSIENLTPPHQVHSFHSLSLMTPRRLYIRHRKWALDLRILTVEKYFLGDYYSLLWRNVLWWLLTFALKTTSKTRKNPTYSFTKKLLEFRLINTLSATVHCISGLANEPIWFWKVCGKHGVYFMPLRFVGYVKFHGISFSSNKNTFIFIYIFLPD